MKKVIEVTARGFDGENDDTDNRVLWVKGQSAQAVKARLDAMGAPYLSVVETDLTTEEASEDCIGFAELVAALFGFVVEDMRAALEKIEIGYNGNAKDLAVIANKALRDSAMVQS